MSETNSKLGQVPGDGEEETKCTDTTLDDGNSDEDGLDESMDGSDDGSLMIADMQDAKETDDTDNEEEDQPKLIFNGLMTRRQSKQFKDASDSYAVYSVRNGTSKSNKNRTCEYCHVVKATPAALVRHLRKHTGERPFVCHIEQCGKSYKAKRSLNLHQSTHHQKESGKTVPTSLTPTPVLLAPSHLPPMPSSPAISEMTKSLLRETLESSRKGKGSNTASQTPEAQALSLSLLSRLPDRLSTPNLVNLLTTDLSKGHLTVDAVTSYLIGSVKHEREDEDDPKNGNMAEEQAEDLSMSSSRRSGRPSAFTTASLERNFKCDFCNKTFRHEISCINHTRTAHGIVLNPHHVTTLPATFDTKPKVVQAPAQVKPEPPAAPGGQKPDSSLDSFMPAARPLQGLVPVVPKVEVPSACGEGDMLDESNTLPYHITSHMAQDLNVDLRLKDSEKSVLAEDGGNRRVRVTVEKETVLATRLDGINNISGRRATVFKCHLCLRIFSSLIRFNHHLPSHCDTEVQTYDCRYCEASFRSHLQIVKHLQCHREKFTGLNQSGTGLNSSALLLEEFNKKHKDQHSTGSVNTSSLLNQSDSSVSITEPGERANGGYSCVKCQKKFSREYLLQRHMRIHQVPNIFFCHACHFSFTSELDLLEHLRSSHGSMQYTNLLKSLNDSKLMHTFQHSDDNNNNSSNSLHGLAGLRPHVFPLVDMKAFDLRRGQPVEVRMASEVADHQDVVSVENVDQSKALRLMMAAGKDKKINSQVLQAFLQAKEPMRHNLTSLEDLRKVSRAAEEKRRSEKARQELEEIKQRMERDKKRLTEEKEKLKQKLAQEGMGDVTVVLPVAPPLDDSATTGAREGDLTDVSDRPTDLSMKSQIGVGFMARKSTQDPQPGVSSSKESKQLPCPTKEAQPGTKRPLAPATDPQGSVPPAKNRRKALKPQRIHCDSSQGETTQPDKGDNNNNNTVVEKTSSQSENSLSAFSQVSLFKSFLQDQSSKPISPQTMPRTSLLTIAPPLPSTAHDPCIDPASGPIDLSTDSRANVKSQAQSTCVSSRLSPPSDEQMARSKKVLGQQVLNRSTSLDLAVSDSDNSLSHELTSAADMSKNSKELGLMVFSSSTSAPGNLPSSPSDPDNLIGFPRVLWKSGEPMEAVSGPTQWNSKESKSNFSANKSQTSSPSPAPSPTNSDISSADGRRATTTSLSRTHSSTRATSLSRTHSRLSVVNEPLDRNSLCKPKLLDDGRSVYSCVICKKNFLSLSDINRHMDFHEDIRPYKCKYCDYYARTNSQLKVHKLRHEGVREFCCRVCNYKGVTQSDLNRHMKSQVHLLRSNHVCSQCGEGFVTPKTLRDHSLCCTGSADKSMDGGVSNNEDDLVDEDYEDEDIEESSQGSSCGLVATEVKVM